MENIKEPHEVQHFATSVNDIELLFHEPKVSGLELMKKADLKHIECLELFQLFEDNFKKIEKDEIIDLSVCYGDVDHLIPGQTDQAIS